jgi:hypothetical protein
MSKNMPSTPLAERIPAINDRVAYILKTYPSTRNNDTYLSWLYVRLFEGIDLPFVKFEKFHAINFETLGRVRRRMQNERHVFVPTNDEIRAARKRKSQIMRRAYRK